ncbi:MAG: hypothetical protein IKP50_00125 [Bacilli bacterium]|nr:hypothetical protein [Bacilli bacterium]
MKYQSKKDPTITAAFDFENEKFKTTRLIYLTGSKEGQSFEISNSTLKRWWKKLESEEVEQNEVQKEEVVETVENPLNIDFEKLAEPYHPEVTPHYIPKPQSVIEYEEKKHKRVKADFDYPKDYETLANLFAERNIKMKKVNRGYISLPDNSKIKILVVGIGILASDELAEKFVAKGFQAKPCIEKGTPFRFDVKNAEEYTKMLEALADE